MTKMAALGARQPDAGAHRVSGKRTSGLLLAAGAVVLAGLVVGTLVNAASEEGSAVAAGSGQTVAGLATKYPNDAGLAKDPDVIFADDFETWSGDGTQIPPRTWTGMHRGSSTRTAAIPGRVGMGPVQGPGSRILLVSCWYAGGGSASTVGSLPSSRRTTSMTTSDVPKPTPVMGGPPRTSRSWSYRPPPQMARCICPLPKPSKTMPV